MPIPDRGNVVGAGRSSQKSWQDLHRHPSVMERVTAFRNTGALLGRDDRSWAAPGYWGLWPSVGEPAKAKPLCYPLQHHGKKVIWSKARAFPTTVIFPLSNSFFAFSQAKGSNFRPVVCIDLLLLIAFLPWRGSSFLTVSIAATPCPLSSQAHHLIPTLNCHSALVT